jgi:hypothetical protein
MVRGVLEFRRLLDGKSCRAQFAGHQDLLLSMIFSENRCPLFRIMLLVNEMVDAIKPGQSDNNEIDRDNEIEQPRHQQDEDAGDQGDKRRDMGGGDDHEIL